jgi:aminomethyltransferase
MIWDRILDEGKKMGIIPCRFTTLDMLRTESYLLFFPFDNSEMYPFADEGPGDTLWELGLDFTVSPGKTGFRGAEEHYRLKGRERFKIYGLKLAGKKVPGNGAPVFKKDKQVGLVTQAMYSPLNDWTVAIARLPVDLAVNGKKLEVRCDQGRDTCAAVLRCRQEAPVCQGLIGPGRLPSGRPPSREDAP